ncbi:MAG: Na+/H+ antiporter subunit C [Rhodocyclaceae bacterium]|nr:Na+/H+ antiporter subunit C [Rhodocyclaceae bacterium]
MEILLASGIGVLIACGVFLMLRSRSFDVVLGLTLMSYGVNLFLFSVGRIGGAAPIISDGVVRYTDPLPQALTLTAIVIGFAMTALLLAVALADYVAERTDHVDGQRGEQRSAAQGRGEAE